jgi:hypothetical protein
MVVDPAGEKVKVVEVHVIRQEDRDVDHFGYICRKMGGEMYPG